MSDVEPDYQVEPDADAVAYQSYLDRWTRLRMSASKGAESHLCTLALQDVANLIRALRVWKARAESAEAQLDVKGEWLESSP